MGEVPRSTGKDGTSNFILILDLPRWIEILFILSSERWLGGKVCEDIKDGERGQRGLFLRRNFAFISSDKHVRHVVLRLAYKVCVSDKMSAHGPRRSANL